MYIHAQNHKLHVHLYPRLCSCTYHKHTFRSDKEQPSETDWEMAQESIKLRSQASLSSTYPLMCTCVFVCKPQHTYVHALWFLAHRCFMPDMVCHRDSHPPWISRSTPSISTSNRKLSRLLRMFRCSFCACKAMMYGLKGSLPWSAWVLALMRLSASLDEVEC